MISAMNYAAQAEAGLRWCSKSMAKMGREYDAAMATLVANLIRDAVHIAIPDDGLIFNDGLKGLKGLPARLPFKSLTVEYFVNRFPKLHELAPVYVPKRLIVAFELSWEEVLELSREKPELLFTEPLLSFRKFDVVNILIVVNQREAFDWWYPQPMGIGIPSNWEPTEKSSRLPTLIEGGDGGFGTGISSIPLVIFPELTRNIMKEVGNDLGVKSMLNDVSGETTALMEMCEALACANVHADVFQEENEKVNRKRRKKNKLPLYETRILTIDVPNIKEHARGKLHGDRSSPRQHLRRGHIRKLSEKKRIWVNSCIVGNKSKGVINKKYEIAR